MLPSDRVIGALVAARACIIMLLLVDVDVSERLADAIKTAASRSFTPCAADTPES